MSLGTPGDSPGHYAGLVTFWEVGMVVQPSVN